jgi:hypothetical protein
VQQRSLRELGRQARGEHIRRVQGRRHIYVAV